MRLSTFILFFVFASLLFAQDNSEVYEDSLDTEFVCSEKSLNIPLPTVGFSLGNSKNFNGIRINYNDCGVGVINGINITFWKSNNFKND